MILVPYSYENNFCLALPVGRCRHVLVLLYIIHRRKNNRFGVWSPLDVACPIRSCASQRAIHFFFFALRAAGASTTDDILKIRLQLTKPVTWIPLIWGVLCGAAASGVSRVPYPVCFIHSSVLLFGVFKASHKKVAPLTLLGKEGSWAPQPCSCFFLLFLSSDGWIKNIA